MKTKNLKKTITRWVLRIVLFFFLSSLAATIIYSFIRVPITPLMIIRLTEGLFSGDPVGIHKKWTPIKEISPNMVRAVVASEDQLFLEHNGFDFNAIDKARKHNEHSRRKRGASTISQQTAKNVFLWPARTWFRKGLEVYFTVLIEIFWSKERIMEVYLNVAEMGNGYYGVGAPFL
ncbi:MAG TPA: monofunctional biosynthetic peptidoglycan transglycosylase [Bacteroidales bacterium]|nr:monofunctional biosynthetic peptidoglycan transglycosylase [Bacteroidales bacterium]